MQFHILKTAVFGLTFLVSGVLVTADEVHQLREKANAVRKEAAALSEKGQKEEAEKLERASRELLEKAEGLESGRHDADPKSKDREPRHIEDTHRLKEWLADLVAAQQKSKESGTDQEFNEIGEQIARVKKMLAHVAAQKGDAIKHKEVPEQFQEQVEKLELAARRMQHVRTAAENLKAAEMHDLAQELMQRAAGMEKEIHAARAELSEQMQAGRKEHGHEPKSDSGELRAENEKLRAELNELRGVVERLKKQSEPKTDDFLK